MSRLAPPDARRLGALGLVLLLLLALPGIALALRYDADPARAHDAVARVDEGPLRSARGAHAWAASALLVLVAVHAARSFVAGRMRAPGRIAALAGIGALALLLAAFFTGTILPWDQQGWEAMQHLGSGAGAARIDIAADEPAQAPLRAVFLFHVLAVPTLLLAALAIHLRRGALRGDARRVGALLRAAWAPALGLAALVALLALALPPALGPAPIAGLSLARPDWPFLWLVPLQDWMGSAALLLLPLVLLAAAGALLLRRGPPPRARRAILAALLALWALLSILGATG